MIALCIDPGTEESGVVLYDGKNVIFKASSFPNDNLLEFKYDKGFDVILIEMIASYGMPVGKTTFETCVWIGRFMQKLGAEKTKFIYRRDVKLHLCNSARAKDKNVRQAILDRFPSSGGGKTPQIGTKNNQGPLYGMTSHAFSALALGITYFETRP